MLKKDPLVDHENDCFRDSLEETLNSIRRGDFLADELEDCFTPRAEPETLLRQYVKYRILIFKSTLRISEPIETNPGFNSAIDIHEATEVIGETTKRVAVRKDWIQRFSNIMGLQDSLEAILEDAVREE